MQATPQSNTVQAEPAALAQDGPRHRPHPQHPQASPVRTPAWPARAAAMLAGGRLRLPPLLVRRRAPDLTYAADDRPPAVALATLALQHAATALALLAYVLAAAKIAGLSAEATRALVSASILSMAAATALQSFGGRFGSGTLLVHIPHPFMLVFAAAAMASDGPGAMVTIAVVAGIVHLIAGKIMPLLRALFPPTVAGVVVCMAGLSLIASALQHALGLDARFAIDGPSLLISGVSFGVIVGLSVWGGRQLKLLGLLAGVAAGVAAAALAGRLGGGELLAAAPVLGLPSIAAPVFGVDPGILAAVVIIMLLSELDTVGSVVIMHKMDDADWRRADMKMVSGGIRANGLGDLVGALFGGFPTSTSSANIALCHATRSTARRVGLATAALLAAVAFLPQVTVALTLIPEPVLGAVELYAAVFLIVSGIELIASRALDSRGVFMVGLSFALGVGIMLMPAVAGHAPQSLQFLLGSGFIVAGVCAIGLNLLFRIGTARRASQSFAADEAASTQAIIDFVETRGAAWAARRDVVTRAAMAALEAAEAIRAAGGRRLLAIAGSFDEFNLDIELRHAGPPLALGATAGAGLEGLLDGEEGDDRDIDAALASLSGVLLRHLADRTTVGERDGCAFLRLHFAH